MLTVPNSGVYATAQDPHTPMSGGLSNGTDSTFRVDVNVTFGGKPSRWWLAETRMTPMKIRHFLPGSRKSDLFTDTAGFPAAGTSWKGIIAVVITAGVLHVYKDGATGGNLRDPLPLLPCRVQLVRAGAHRQHLHHLRTGRPRLDELFSRIASGVLV